MKLRALLIRTTVGALFIGHGTQKLFGWFGGHGPDATGGAFEQMGLRPGKRHALAAGAAEAGSGLLLVLGALTPVAAATVIGTMVTAVRKVHLKNGPWATEGGYEYNLLLILTMYALAENGPGPLSVDERLLPNLKGTGVALAALGAGAAGSYLVTSEIVNEPENAEGQEAADTAAASGGEPVRETAGAR